jgi:hypothetical protein
LESPLGIKNSRAVLTCQQQRDHFRVWYPCGFLTEQPEQLIIFCWTYLRYSHGKNRYRFATEKTIAKISFAMQIWHLLKFITGIELDS